MLTGSSMAVARHLFAAIHFRLSHLVVGQTGKGRRDRPHNYETHDDNGTDLHHT
jgi:hypothetical protein